MTIVEKHAAAEENFTASDQPFQLARRERTFPWNEFVALGLLFLLFFVRDWLWF